MPKVDCKVRKLCSKSKRMHTRNNCKSILLEHSSTLFPSHFFLFCAFCRILKVWVSFSKMEFPHLCCSWECSELASVRVVLPQLSSPKPFSAPKWVKKNHLQNSFLIITDKTSTAKNLHSLGWLSFLKI